MIEYLYTPQLRKQVPHIGLPVFRGPYCVIEINGIVVDLERVDDPGGAVLRVVANTLRHCPEEIDACRQAVTRSRFTNE